MAGVGRFALRNEVTSILGWRRCRRGPEYLVRILRLLDRMAGVGRFELPRARVKVLCLTAWRYPIICNEIKGGGAGEGNRTLVTSLEG